MSRMIPVQYKVIEPGQPIDTGVIYAKSLIQAAMILGAMLGHKDENYGVLSNKRIVELTSDRDVFLAVEFD